MRDRTETRFLAYMRGKELLQASGCTVATVVIEVVEAFRLTPKEAQELTGALERFAAG